MKNIAILIGNSDYESLDKLPCCNKDISLMRQVLELSKKFEIKVFENYKSEKLKEELAGFIQDNQKSNQKIDDLLFYYTGHGTFNKQFSYLPINFDEKRYETTSLSNDELDDMLKSLNAKLLVKIIDACHSGQQYIKDKDADIIKQYFEKEKHSFNKLYFFFSSLSNQSSYGDKDGSKFTVAIIDSILNHTENSIRYRDVKSYIADFFQNQEQTPFFVSQADATEIFLPDLKIIKEKSKSNSKINSNTIDTAKENDKVDEAKILKSLSKNYITKDEAKSIISNIFKEESIKKCIETNLYEFDIKPYNNYSCVKNIEKLYNEVEKNKEKFFINITYKDEKYKTIEMVPKPKKRNNLFGSYYNIWAEINQEYVEKEVEKVRKVVSGFSANDDITPIGVSVTFIPKKNLNVLSRYIVNIVTLHNDINIVLYSNLIKCDRNSWDSWDNLKTKDWIKNVCTFGERDKIDSLIKDILRTYYQEIKVDIDKIIANANIQQDETIDKKTNARKSNNA
ncbi:caspase family protein [Helicobacter sp. T3_23-1059]